MNHMYRENAELNTDVVYPFEAGIQFVAVPQSLNHEQQATRTHITKALYFPFEGGGHHSDHE